jgi:hypothetical protein
MTIVTAQVFGSIMGISPQAARKHCRNGVLARAAFRGPAGNWLIHLEAGRAALLANRDLSHASVSLIETDDALRKAERARVAEAKRAAVAAPEPEPLVEWVGPGGRFVAPASVAAALKAACASPDLPLMNQALIEACDRVLVALGELPPDFKIGQPIEPVEPPTSPAEPTRST